MYITSVDSLELHEGDYRLFTVYTHGERNLTLHVDDVEVEDVEWVLFSDPNSSHGDRYSEVHFDDPRTISVEDDELSVLAAGEHGGTN